MKNSILLFLMICGLTKVLAQGPFGCVEEAYLFQYNDVYGINLASGQSFPVATDITAGNINAVAYNPTDGYIWGYISSPANSVVKVGEDFSTETYTIEGYRSAYVGAINANGIFYSKAGGTSYDIVDLNPKSVTYLKVLEQRNLTQNISIADYGAVYFDLDGNFYVSANQTGTIYQISKVQDLQSGSAISSTVFSYGPASAANDGARCPTAPVPQEICGNGIDDDGDSLIDCEDPSCSEYVDCIDEGVSGGNSGGLESNNRLSQAIAERNYQRTKNKASYSAIIGNKLADNNAFQNQALTRSLLDLKDLIPIGIIDETSAYESSPRDLIDITNAEEVFSVDYFENESSVASVLALKTSNGVYEHSKFICDRLLGAELNSVSTVFIKDQPLIRSIIYRPDGKREFVLSFSVRIHDEGAIIESHWNLDRYTKDESYYNFQIWTSSINDLVSLAEGIIDLIELRLPILEYKHSSAPYVFVRRAAYKNGVLQLDIRNNDFSESITIEGGLRETETEAMQNLKETISLQPYDNKVKIETGSLFDLGFRITSDRKGTPDDLFVSDGPWGYDDSSTYTNVIDYSITKNATVANDNEYGVERTVHLTAMTSEYVAAYRALTPRFEAVDLSAYSNLQFSASGTGRMEVMLVKSSVDEWSRQVKTEVLLSEEQRAYELTLTDFKNLDGDILSWDDVKMITFTMRASDGSHQEKIMQIGDIRFTQSTSSVIEEIQDEKIGIVPNPVNEYSIIKFDSSKNGHGLVQLINNLGETIMSDAIQIEKGHNIYEFINKNYPSGSYFLSIQVEGEKPYVSKLIIQN